MQLCEREPLTCRQATAADFDVKRLLHTGWPGEVDDTSAYVSSCTPRQHKHTQAKSKNNEGESHEHNSRGGGRAGMERTTRWLVDSGRTRASKHKHKHTDQD